MSDYRAEIQYRGQMNYGHGYHHYVDSKSHLERSMDWEDALKEVSKLPPAMRKSALREILRRQR